jgi:alpha-acetolactate decarboxylase
MAKYSAVVRIDCDVTIEVSGCNSKDDAKKLIEREFDIFNIDKQFILNETHTGWSEIIEIEKLN